MKDFRSLTMHQALDRQAEGAGSLPEWNLAMAEAVIRENPALGAFTDLLDPEPTSRSGNGALSGFSAAIKANIALCDAPTHCGSRLLADYRSPFDSTVIQRLRAAGCAFSGITTMDEFGMGSSCEHTTLGRVVNPWNSAFTAGGSSGGSAAAVAAGLAWFALGSDTGGSVRLPAHFCGVVGLKPTYGRISRFGLVAFVSSLDTIGILARDVRDAFTVFQTLAGGDSRDATSLDRPVLSASLPKKSDLKGIRLGVPQELDELALDPEVRANLEESLERMKGLGGRLVPVSIRGILNMVPVYTVLSCAEAASNLHRYDGTLFGVRKEGETYLDSVAATRNAGFGSEVKRRLLLGAHVLSAGYREQYYLKACRARQELIKSFDRLFETVDFLAMPTAPWTAFPLGTFADNPVGMHLADTLTVPASLGGLPAVTIPTGLDSRGLPLSLQLLGPACGEEKLLATAGVLENDLDFRSREGAPWMKES